MIGTTTNIHSNTGLKKKIMETQKGFQVNIISIIIIVLLVAILGLFWRSKSNIIAEYNIDVETLKNTHKNRVDSIELVVVTKDNEICDLKEQLEVATSKKEKVRIKYIQKKEENDKKEVVTYEDQSFELWLCESYVDELTKESVLKDTLIHFPS
jgi:hypothetical protein